MLVHQERLRLKMAEEKLDAIIATTLENVYYFTGVRNVTLDLFPHEGQCYVIVTSDRPTEPFVVCPTLDTDQFVNDCIAEMRGTTTYGTFFRESPFGDLPLSNEDIDLRQRSDMSAGHSSPSAALLDALTQLGLSAARIGIDELQLSDHVRDELHQALPNATFAPASDHLRWVRRVKTTEEIRRLKASAKITENAILATIAIISEGITEIELQREFERSIVSQGGQPRFSFIRIGGNAVAGQSKATRRALRKGDILWFDVGCTYQGYWSDIARNVSLGEPEARAHSIYEAMLQGEEHAIKEVRPGMTGETVFDLTMQASRAAGKPDYRRHHVGHGIGVEVYEQAILAPGNTQVIEAGAVVNIETPYYEYGLGALHVEDPFVVGDDGNEVLTSISRDMFIVD